MPEMNRPLSPHLSVYKWNVTSVSSILHRATGVFMTLGTVALAAWIISAAMGADCYEYVLSILSSWIGWLVMFGLSFSFFYHLANGVRHLVWDAGYGFDKQVARRSGWAAIVGALVATLLFWAGVMA